LHNFFSAPPRPIKTSIYESSPEVPPKLPMRARVSEAPVVKRAQRIPYSVVDIAVDDSELDFDCRDSDLILRDSGISTHSQEAHNFNVNNNNNNVYSTSTNSLPISGGYNMQLRGHQKNNSNPEDFIHPQMHPEDCDEITNVPALPPKGFFNQSYEDNENYTDNTSESSLPLPPLPPIKQQHQQQNYATNAEMICVVSENIIQPCCDYENNVEVIQPCCEEVPCRENEEECDQCFCDNPPPACCN
jgi:hypothetical protein